MEEGSIVKKVRIAIIVGELFQVSLLMYLVLVLAETVKGGFVSSYFNLNYLLGVVLISGVLMVLTSDWYKGLKSEKKEITEKDVYYIFTVSIGAMVIVYYKTQELGKISIAITAISGLIIFLLSLLIFSEDNN